jgi:monothiol glutaredoxin
MALDNETRGIIDHLLSTNKVVLFMKGTPQQPQCGFSATTVSTLEMLIPDFMSVNVLEYPSIREGIKEYANWPTIPQLYIDGELIGGSDIVTDMLHSGELADTLGVEKPEIDAPVISIDDKGIEVMKKALDAQPGHALHLQIDAGWSHKISLSADKRSAVQAKAGDIEIHMDPWSAARADGLKMVMEEDLTGTRFSFDNPNAPPPVNQMTVQTLKEKLDGEADVILIDVRTDEERSAASISGSRQWNEEAMDLIESLPKDAELIFHCHSGGRSQALAESIRRSGYTNLHNVSGGIQAWAEEIDKTG